MHRAYKQMFVKFMDENEIILLILFRLQNLNKIYDISVNALHIR